MTRTTRLLAGATWLALAAAGLTACTSASSDLIPPVPSASGPSAASGRPPVSGAVSSPGQAPGALSGSAGPTAAVPAAGSGVLQGHLYVVGGPPPGLHAPVPGTVTVTGPGFRTSLSVGDDGFYSVSVPPGQYRVEGTSPRVMVFDKPAVCPAELPATVVAGGVATLDPICSLP